MTCVYKAKSADFPLNHPESFQSCACTRRRATGRKKEVTYWRKAQCRGRADGNGGRSREPQVRGHQPHSSELITPSISLSDPERKEGGRMEQLALRWPRGEESWLLDSGSDFWGRKLDVWFFFLRLCGNVCLWTFMRTGGGYEFVCVCFCVSVSCPHMWNSTSVTTADVFHAAGMMNEPVWYWCCQHKKYEARSSLVTHLPHSFAPSSPAASFLLLPFHISPSLSLSGMCDIWRVCPVPVNVLI